MMGASWILWFNNSDDVDIIKDIAKIHNLPEYVVAVKYKAMLEAVKDEAKN